MSYSLTQLFIIGEPGFFFYRDASKKKKNEAKYFLCTVTVIENWAFNFE